MRRAAFAGLVVGTALLAIWPASRLASYLAARSLARLTPAPFATIDRPSSDATVERWLVIGGRVVHETIRAPLWLLFSRAGGAWEPDAALDTTSGTWQRSVWLAGRNGTKYRFVVIAAPHPLPASFVQVKEDLEKERWRQHLVSKQFEEGGGHDPWASAPLGDGKYPPLPAGARLVASVDVVVHDTTSVPAPLMKGGPRGR